MKSFFLAGAIAAILLSLTSVVVPIYGVPQTYTIPPPAAGTYEFDMHPGLPVRGWITVTAGAADLILVVDSPTANPGGTPPAGIFELGKYVQITITQSPARMVSCTFNIYYTDSEVLAAGLNEAQMAIYRWTGSEWQALPTISGSDAYGKYLQTTVTSFSNFAPLGPKAAAVGGYMIFPNKLDLLSPYLVSVGLLGAAVAMAVVVSRRRRV